MIDLRLAPVVRVLVPFAGGSLAGYLGGFSFRPAELVITCLGLWLFLVLSYHLSRRKAGISSGLFSTQAFGLFLCTGLGTGILSKPEDPGLPVRETVVISGKILEGPQDRNSRYQFEIRLQMVDTGDTVYQPRTIIKATMIMPTDSILPS